VRLEVGHGVDEVLEIAPAAPALVGKIRGQFAAERYRARSISPRSMIALRRIAASVYIFAAIIPARKRTIDRRTSADEGAAMQAYDLVMLIVMAGAIFFGFWKGLAWQVVSTGSLVVSYFVALNFREPVSHLISADPPWNMFLAMLALFVGSWIAVWLGFSLLKSGMEKMKLKDFDRQAGALLGAIKGALLCILITFFAVTLLGEKQRDAICRSHSGHYISIALNHADAVMPQEIHAKLDPYLNKLEKGLDGADGPLDGFYGESGDFDFNQDFGRRLSEDVGGNLGQELGRELRDRFDERFGGRTGGQTGGATDEEYTPEQASEDVKRLGREINDLFKESSSNLGGGRIETRSRSGGSASGGDRQLFSGDRAARALLDAADETFRTPR
jgi:membrane protein required for colicin V production